WLSIVLDEIAEQGRFHQRQRHPFIFHANLELLEVDRTATERELTGRDRRRMLAIEPSREPLAPPKEALDPSDQNREFERFRQVIVGAGLKSAQHIFGTAARGQHEDGNELTSAAQFGDDAKPIDARQHHVEDYEVEACRIRRNPSKRGFTFVY